MNVRIDTHIYGGYQISPHYDAMIAKIMTHDRTRERAIQKMRRVLSETVIAPIRTNLDFQAFLMEHPNYVQNKIDIHFLKNNGLLEEDDQ